MKSGARSENIVDQEQVLRAGRAVSICFIATRTWRAVGNGPKGVVGISGPNTIDDARAYTEGALDVCGLAFDGEFCLGAGAAAALKDIGAEFGAKSRGTFACNDFGLVVSAGPLSCPLQRDRDDSIHIFEMLRPCNPLSEHPAKTASRRNVAVVFQLSGNIAVPAVCAIKEQGRGIGVILSGRDAAFARSKAIVLARLRSVLPPLLYERIELISHRIELPDPIISPRKIFQAIAANVHFCWPQDAFAYYTLAGKKKVQRGSKTTPDNIRKFSLSTISHLRNVNCLNVTLRLAPANTLGLKWAKYA